MNLIIDSFNNPMRKEDIGLDLLITEVIISLERYLLMKHNRLSPDLLLEVPTKLLLTSAGPTKRGGSTTRSNISGVFVYGRPHPDGSEECSLMSTINFDHLLGRTFFASYG